MSTTYETKERRRNNRNNRNRDMIEALKNGAPEGVTHVIVAEAIENQTDSMTDYFGHRTRLKVVLGYRKSKRESFKALRKAAASFPATADLATGPKAFEHRDNYSMGAGNYLKEEWIHNTGWLVRSVRIDWLSQQGRMRVAF